MTNKTAGPVARAAGYYGKIEAGTLNISGIAGTQLDTNSVSIFEVLVQNDPDSANTIAVGNANGQYVKIAAGNDITVQAENLNIVYVSVPNGGTATVNYIAMA